MIKIINSLNTDSILGIYGFDNYTNTCATVKPPWNNFNLIPVNGVLPDMKKIHALYLFIKVGYTHKVVVLQKIWCLLYLVGKEEDKTEEIQKKSVQIIRR